MNLETLMQEFFGKKEYKPQNLDELLDFLQQYYVNGKISILEYGNLYRELEAQGARNVNEQVPI